MRNLLGVACLWFGITTLLFAQEALPAQTPPQRKLDSLEFKRVFHRKAAGQYLVPYLAPEGDRIYLVGGGRNVSVIDWQSGRTLVKKKVPFPACAGPFEFLGRDIGSWQLIPGGRESVAEWCNDWFVVNTEDLSVRTLLRNKGDLIVSDAGNAVVIRSGSSVLLFATSDWVPRAIPDEADYLSVTAAFNATGDALSILEVKTNAASEGEECKLRVLRVPSGEALSEFPVRPFECGTQRLAAGLYPLAGGKESMVTVAPHDRSYQKSVWNIETGKLLNETELTGLSRWGPPARSGRSWGPVIVVSPDWTWVIGHSQRYGEFQEFVALDVVTGKTLFTSPIKKSCAEGCYSWVSGSYDLGAKPLGLSRDGKYLLSPRDAGGDWMTLYEVIAHYR